MKWSPDRDGERRQVRPPLLPVLTPRYRAPGPPEEAHLRVAYEHGVQTREAFSAGARPTRPRYQDPRENRAYWAGFAKPADPDELAAPVSWPVQIASLLLDARIAAAPEDAEGLWPKARQVALWVAAGLLKMELLQRLERRRAKALGLTVETAPCASGFGCLDSIGAAVAWQLYRWLRGFAIAPVSWPRTLATGLISEIGRRRSWRAAGGPTRPPRSP